MVMPVLTTSKTLYPNSMKHVSIQPKDTLPTPVNSQNIPLRSANLPKSSQSTSVQRRSLNISHFNALHSAVSNLARIDDFDLEELGYGFFSDVFKATHKQTGQVMVLKRNKDTNSKMNILREVQLMNRLSSPYILRFKGVCVHQGQLHALTEFINGGDLDKFVTNKENILTWKQRIQLALDIARGINYLHSMGIFHRDLSAKNCLIQIIESKGRKKYKCIVADLGLAEKIPTTAEEMARLSMVGTPYIMAPEVLRRKPYNEKADVFSFGLIVCQLIARVSYEPEELPRSSDFGLARDLFQKLVSKPSPPGTSIDTALPPPSAFLQLAYDCCQIDPGSRPSFKEIVCRLEEMMLRRSHVIPPASFKVGGEIKFHQSRFGCNSPSTSRKNYSPPHDVQKRVRVGSASRLTRSQSDISRDMVQHAASVVSSTWIEESIYSDDSEEDEFSNPFEELEHLNCNRIKLTDEPSLALLEMTFDLASTESLKVPLRQVANAQRRNRRPNSTYTDGKLLVQQDPVSHHHSSSSVHLHPRAQELRDAEQTGRSPRVSSSEELVSQCEDCNLQRARHRAMILSPLGNHLLSSWCSRHVEVKEDLENQRQYMATVMSVLSRGLLNLRRSISVPDLSQASSLFHHVGAEAETRILHTLPHAATGSESCSSDDLFVENDSTSSQNLPQTTSKETIPNFSEEPDPSKRSLEESTSEIEAHSESLKAESPSFSNSFDISLKTGELTKQQRRKKTLNHVPSSNLPEPTSLNLPECIVTDLSKPPKSSNRDSGYEETITIPHSPSTDLYFKEKCTIPE